MKNYNNFLKVLNVVSSAAQEIDFNGKFRQCGSSLSHVFFEAEFEELSGLKLKIKDVDNNSKIFNLIDQKRNPSLQTIGKKFYLKDDMFNFEFTLTDDSYITCKFIPDATFKTKVLDKLMDDNLIIDANIDFDGVKGLDVASNVLKCQYIHILFKEKNDIYSATFNAKNVSRTTDVNALKIISDNTDKCKELEINTLKGAIPKEIFTFLKDFGKPIDLKIYSHPSNDKKLIMKASVSLTEKNKIKDSNGDIVEEVIGPNDYFAMYTVIPLTVV